MPKTYLKISEIRSHININIKDKIKEIILLEININISIKEINRKQKRLREII